MLIQNTLETLRHLKLHGMALTLEEQRETPTTHEPAFEVRLALLVDRERLRCIARTAATGGYCARRA